MLNEECLSNRIRDRVGEIFHENLSYHFSAKNLRVLLQKDFPEYRDIDNHRLSRFVAHAIKFWTQLGMVRTAKHDSKVDRYTWIGI